MFPSFPRGTQGRARKQRPVTLRDAKVPSVTETRGRQEGNGTVPGRARVLIERRWTGDVNRYLDTEKYSFVSEDFIYLVLASIFLLCVLLLMPRRPLQLRPLVTTAPATPLSLARGRGASELFRGPDASIWDRRGSLRLLRAEISPVPTVPVASLPPGPLPLDSALGLGEEAA